MISFLNWPRKFVLGEDTLEAKICLNSGSFVHYLHIFGQIKKDHCVFFISEMEMLMRHSGLEGE